MTANYCVIFLGDQSAQARPSIEAALTKMAMDFGLHSGAELEFLDADDTLAIATASVAIYFGSSPPVAIDHDDLLSRGVPIVPVVSTKLKAGSELPKSISTLNAISLEGPDPVGAIASTVMENLNLLPRQRRVFISYIRTEATVAALQLFAELEARQFRVFVDTHGVRYGENFQDELWHNLSDCDVMVMLDTSKYFVSQWTTAEFAKANLKKASILRVAFPGVTRDDSLSITEDLALQASNVDALGKLDDFSLDNVCDRIERLRSKSIAARTAAIVGSLRAAAEDMKGSVSPLGAMRRVEVTLPGGKRVLLYPAIGVPTAVLLHEVADNAAKMPAAIVYDKFGVRESWIRHLNWLGEHVPHVRWIQSWEAPTALSKLDAEL